jgi:L-amino acid N-acyltransferase YncA
MIESLMALTVRRAAFADAGAIADIYNEGIADRIATFETRPRSAADVASWFDGRHPVVVVEDEAKRIVAFAATFPYRSRDCYEGVAEFSVYVSRQVRGRGAGRIAMDGLIAAATEARIWKLVSRVFPANTASRALLQSVGFREVGTYEKHAKLDGHWLDAVIVERLIHDNLD